MIQESTRLFPILANKPAAAEVAINGHLQSTAVVSQCKALGETS